MNNGQLNIDSAPAVVQSVIPGQTAPAAVTMLGVQQNGGEFAKMLSGIQLQSKEKGQPDSGQAEELQAGTGKHQHPLDESADDPAVNLLAQLNLSSRITMASEPDAQKPENSEKKDVSADAVQLDGEPADITSQMALVAYSQPGRMPEVNSQTLIPVDRLQNAAIAIEQQPDVITAPPVEKQEERLQPFLRSSVTATVPADVSQPAKSDRMSDANNLIALPDMLQKVATVKDQPAVITAPPVEKQVDPIVSKPLTERPAQSEGYLQPFTQYAVAATVPTDVSQPAKSDRTSDVNIQALLHVDRLQNVATVTEQPAIFSASPDKIQVGQPLAEPVQKAPVQAPVTLSATTATVPVPDEPIVPSGAKTADLPAMPAEKTAAVTPESELPSAHLTASVPATSPESEIELHLSQQLPITTGETAAPVLADNIVAAPARELRGARQRPNPEQQIEKVRTGNEQSVAKENASSLQAAATASEASSDPDTSLGGNNQGQSDFASDNQLLTQNMSGQLKTEHQGITTKAVPTEPARQEIPEQVLQQVKERLVLHDVKPGSQQITLTLSPDSLGELKMNLNLQGQKLSVEIVTENRAVRDAIVLHTDALKESLARQNITMESFDVTTGGKGTGNQGQNQNAWRELAKQQQQQQQFWASPRGYQTAQTDLPAGQSYQRQPGDSMLDIHY